MAPFFGDAPIAQLIARPVQIDAAHTLSARTLALTLASAERAAALVQLLARHGARAAADGATLRVLAIPTQLAAALADGAQFSAEIVALQTSLQFAFEPPQRLRLRGRSLDLAQRAHVMGILNVTPDSFYERVQGVSAALERARAIVGDGAALVDIGGQSYAHWNARIAADEERERVEPVVAAIVADGLDVALSIDTFKASVAEAALAAGAHLINDCSGLSDPQLASTVAKYDAALVVMHLKGELNVRSESGYQYDDVMAEIVEFLYERTQRALAAGVARDSIAIDPGLEFGKEPTTDLEILQRFGELTALGYPILFASSRKSFIGRIFNRPARELLVPSLATAAIGIAAGARLLRVHDVPETVQLARMYEAVAAPGQAGLDSVAAMPGTPAAGGNSAGSATV